MPGSATSRSPWSSRLLGKRRIRQLLALSLLGAVSISAAFLLTPSRFTPTIPGDEALGTPFAGTLKAHTDFVVVDGEATSRRREEAARSVWPVYDYDGDASDLIQRRIANAFALGRAAVEEWKRDNPARAQRASRRGPEANELVRFLVQRRDEFWKALQAVVDDDTYTELARSGFDPAVDRAAERLAGVVESGPIVAEKQLLSADRDSGLVVRALISGAPSAPEQAVKDVQRIRDLADARAELEKLASDSLGSMPAPLRHAAVQVVRRALRPNLAYDDAETRRRREDARALVKDVLLQIRRGEKIIGDGEPVTREHLLVFHALRAAGRASEAAQVRWGGGLFAAILCATLFEFGRRNVRKFRLRSRDVFLLAALLVLQLLLVRGGLFASDALQDPLRGVLPRFGGPLAQALPALVPYALGPLLVRFLLHSEAALLWTAAFAPLCGLLAGGALQPVIVALVGGVVAADRIGHAGSRAGVFRAGLFTGLATAVVLGSFAMFQGRFWSWDTAATLGVAVLGGALVLPLLTLLLAPLIEAAFGYVTDIELLQLASFNHPLLKDLIVQAPGTYHHAILIGQLVDAAAREIGANPLLARVGAYYHDIGKGKNPLFFGENQKGDNRHDQLSPLASAQLIKRHVADGIELARAAKLPRQVVDFIAQHHGTRAVGYFLHRAREEAERGGLPTPREADFRYEGPRPQTRESALVMLGDVVVAMSRNVTAPNAESLRQIVDAAIQAVVAEGQFDECEITLRDLEITARSFAASLTALYGARAETPPGAQTTLQRSAVLRVLDPPAPRRAGTPQA